MSVTKFENAIAARPNTRIALVSERLFFLLDDQGKVEMREVSKALPSQPQNGGPILTKLRKFVGRTGEPLRLTTFVLAAASTVTLDFGYLHATSLDDLGENSFMLF